MQVFKYFSKNGKDMSLRAKINMLVLLNVLIVLTLVMIISSYIVIQMKFEEAGQRALSIAQIVSEVPIVINAFKEPNPSAIIQPYVEDLRMDTGAEFIVVGNMDLIRYSHPDPEKIGQTMVGNDDEQVLKGRNSITQAVGTLGLSVRGKAPIYDETNKQIGVVSVGFLVKDIWNQLLVYLFAIAGIGVIGAVIGLIGAYLVSGHIKKQIFNMEPAEIAFLTQEQAAIMESIREGVLAVDINGRVTACNQEAKRILELETEQNIAGRPVISVVPQSRLLEVLATGTSHFDQPMIIENTLVVVNRIPVLLKGRVIGAVATFRDKMQLDQIDQRLADVRRYVEALRSQRHEFMNKLHTISGLITIQEYDMARKLIDQVNNEQQQVLEFFLARIQDPAIVGILIGKLHRAKELGIQFAVDPRSQLQDPCPHRELVVTILGNAVENAFEALANWKRPTREAQVLVNIEEVEDRLVITVKDSGPGIDLVIKDRIFEDGVSTKGEGRGFGLALLFRRIMLIGGKLSIGSDSEGTILVASLPGYGNLPD